jgi:L-histidine Nalpha-methyltransferase / hercynylcysteine S-oxide synthase
LYSLIRPQSHSEVPQTDEDWPSLGAILAFQGRVRERLCNLYNNIDSGEVQLTRKVARVLFMTLEHEAFHAETLLYMLLQRAGTGTIPPSGFVPPAWDMLAASWDAAPLPAAQTATLGPETVVLGHDDLEADDESTDVAGHDFGWDNESPRRAVHVGEFSIEWRPVTNGEFYDFYVSGGKEKVKFPASWVEVQGAVQVAFFCICGC